MTGAGSTDHGADHPSGETPAAEPELTDADRIRTAVLACRDVVDVAPGAFGEVASYLPGRTVPGVRVDDDRVEVHIVATYGPALHDVADRIGASVHDLLRGRPLRVCVDDILLPGESLDATDADTTDGAPGT